MRYRRNIQNKKGCDGIATDRDEMKKYIREIEISGMIMMLIGCVCHRFLNLQWAIWVCIIGLALWVLQVVYKAFNWQVYQRENKQNILMMLFVIAMLFFLMLRR